MRLSELLIKDGLSLSFEVFPPKTDSAFESVEKATEEIAALRPAFDSAAFYCCFVILSIKKKKP